MVNYKINVYLKHTEMENMYVREFIELVTQDINGNNFEFTVYEDDNVYDLTNKRVTMVVKSDSGTVIQENCQVVDAKQGKATITLPPDMLIENGPYMAEVQIWEGVNSRVTTLPFDYTVRLSLENDESIKADPRFSLLQVALQNVNDADGKSKEALKLSKEAKAICDDLVPKANTAAQNAQTALDRAESVVTQEELAQKVTLDGKDTKFDFIKNQVVKDGLIEYVNKKITGAHVVNKLDISNDFTLVGCIRNYNKTTLWYVPNVGQMRLVVDAQSNKLTINGFEDRRILETDATPIIEFAMIKQGSRFTISINGIIAVTDLKYADEDIINKWNTNKFSFGYNSATLEVEYTCNNRALAQQEVQHIFSVINNTPSIKELHTTNAEGETSILKLASNEDHVEMASGRTLREEYMGVLKTMGKEFTSADGSPIEVNKGIKARLISGEIKGQTVKCISKLLKYTHDASTGRTKDVNLQLEKAKYTFSVEVTENVGNTILGFIFKDGASDVYKNIPINGVGFFKNVIDLSTCINNPRLYAIYATESGVSGSNKLVEQVNILYGEVNLITGLVDKGLSSTQAIVSNNGQQYPIYANEEDKANKKVISLGGVGDVKDTLEILEDGSAIWVQNTKEIVLNGSENITNETSVNKINTLYFMIQTGDDAVKNTTNNNAVSSNFKSVSASMLWNNDEEAVSCDTVPRIRIDRSKLTTQDVAGFKEYLKSNSLTVRYKLATPIITHIPKEIVPTIRTHNQTNILEVGGAVKPSSFKVTVPVDRIAEQQAEIDEIKKQLGAVAALQLAQIN